MTAITETAAAARNLYLALYTGPCGPISREFDAESLDEARRTVAEQRSAWFDNAEDELGLDASASSEEVDAALAEGCWELALGLDDGWGVYVLGDPGE